MAVIYTNTYHIVAIISLSLQFMYYLHADRQVAF